MSLIDLRPQRDYVRQLKVTIEMSAYFPAGMQGMVAAARSRSDWVSALDLAVKRLGFDTFLYAFSTVARPSTEAKLWTFSTLPLEWVRHYETRAYMEVDPRVQGLFLSPLPCIWDQTLRGTNPRLDAFLDDARRFGIRSGVSFYLSDGGEFNYMVAYNSDRPIVDEARRHTWLEKQGEFMTFGIYFHALFMKPLIARGIAPSLQGTPLSQRELETLMFVVQGLTHEEIGARMGITARTVQAHTDSIRAKLNANTIGEAVFLATRAGLLDRTSISSP